MTQTPSLAVTPLSMTLRAPLATARGTVETRNGWLVAYRDEDGFSGVGEATPLESAGTESPDACIKALTAAAARTVPAPRRIWDVDGWIASLGVGLKTPAARFALETAALDLISRRHGVPIAQLFNPQARTTIPVNALLSGGLPEATRLRDDGYTILKMKVGMDDAADLARVQEVLQLDGVTLRLDANGGWDLERAAAFLGRLPASRVEYCEDPLPDATQAPALMQRCHVPIAADGWLRTMMESQDLIRQKRAHVLILKPAVLGGLIPSLAVAQQAHQHGLGCVVTSTLDGTVARLAAAHLACALPGEPRAAGLATGALFSHEAVVDPAPPLRGVLTLPKGPGLGVTP